jgi:SNF2 family DNA or RNA helicase
VFHKSVVDATTIDGYSELLKADQELLHQRLIKSATEEDEDAKPLDPDSLVRKTWTEKKEPSADLLMPLLPYQKEGLGWMSSQEHAEVHGGILADEMGMGELQLLLSAQKLAQWSTNTLISCSPSHQRVNVSIGIKPDTEILRRTIYALFAQ